MEHQDPHPQLALLFRQYARDLAQSTPSSSLDARIDRLVADRGDLISAPPRPRKAVPFFAAAACFAILAAGAGIYIGMRYEQSRHLASAGEASERDAVWPPADLAMWPTDSVSFKIPAEYTPQGKLVAVDPDSKHGSTRYWIDVVVSNDGTFRIEQIVPADPAQKKGAHDGVAPQVQ
jgi:hypothetical protein